MLSILRWTKNEIEDGTEWKLEPKDQLIQTSTDTRSSYMIRSDLIFFYSAMVHTIRLLSQILKVSRFSEWVVRKKEVLLDLKPNQFQFKRQKKQYERMGSRPQLLKLD
jgi:hypothetical protein